MSLKKRVADFLSGSLQMAPAKRVSVHSPTSSDEDSDKSSFDAAGLLATATSAGAPPLPGTPTAASPASRPPVHSSHADQGGRPYMEDALAHAEVAPGAAAYAVFDGHGGAAVADFCAANLLPRLAAGLEAAGPCPRSSAGGGTAGHGAPDGPAVAAALRGAFDAVDRELQGLQEAHMCGTTAAVCVVTQDWVYTANCGDSRVVLVRPNRVIPLTVDHACTRHDERERIKRAGGQVVWSNGLRVMGALSMTRALGDHFLRRHGVIPEPEIAATLRTAVDEFLIVATDGLWNFVSNEEAAGVARRALARAAALPPATAALVVPRALTKLALARGGSDNVTVTYVDLRRPPAAAPALALVPACAPVPAPVAAPAPTPVLALAAVPEPEAAEAAAPAAGAAASSPFLAPGLQLPALSLRPIRTRHDEDSLPPAAAARAASDPSMERCRSAALPWDADGEGLSPLGMLRAKSAPVRMHHHTVTTGGPLVPARALAAAPAPPLSALGVCACGGAAAADGGPLACRRSAGGRACAAACLLRSLSREGAAPLAAALTGAGSVPAAGPIAVGGASAWGSSLGSMACDG